MKNDRLMEKLSITLSLIFHPLLISIPLGVLFLTEAGFAFLRAVQWMGISIAAVMIPQVLIIKHQGHSILEYRNYERKSRNILYATLILTSITLAGIFYLTGAPKILLETGLAVIATGIMGGLANRISKVSIHVGTLSGFAAGFSFYSPFITVFLMAAAAATAWSRIRLRAHTPLQVILGGLIPATVVAATFTVL